MHSITKDYLTDIIFRTVNETIHERRASQKNHFYYLNYPVAREEELLDFIQSIPYFDETLKHFLMHQPKDASTIISQVWETTFIVKCKVWAHSEDWLHKDPIVSIGFYPEYISKKKDCLTLPY